MAKTEKIKTKYYSYHVVVKGLKELAKQLELIYASRDIIQLSVTPHSIPNSSTWNYSVVYTTSEKENEIEFRDL